MRKAAVWLKVFSIALSIMMIPGGAVRAGMSDMGIPSAPSDSSTPTTSDNNQPVMEPAPVPPASAPEMPSLMEMDSMGLNLGDSEPEMQPPMPAEMQMQEPAQETLPTAPEPHPAPAQPTPMTYQQVTALVNNPPFKPGDKITVTYIDPKTGETKTVTKTIEDAGIIGKVGTEGNYTMLIFKADEDGPSMSMYVDNPNSDVNPQVWGNSYGVVQIVSIEVVPPNRPPAVDPNTLEIDVMALEGKQFTSMDLNSYFADPDGDALTITATGLPAGMVIHGGILQGTPAAGSANWYVVTVTATDPSGESAELFINLDVRAPEKIGEIDFFKQKIENYQRLRKELMGWDASPRTEQEGTTIVIRLSSLFSGDDVNGVTYQVTGLPPGLQVDNNQIIGQLPLDSAGQYNIVVTAIPPPGSPDSPATANIPMTVIPYQGGLISSFGYFMSQGTALYNLNYNSATQQLMSGPTPIEQSFSTSFAQIASIPYISNDFFRFNCDSFGTCVQLAAGADYFVYEFQWAIEVQTPANLGVVGDLLEAIGGQPVNAYTTQTVYHEVNLVWLGRTSNGAFDFYGIWEPQQGKFISRFVMPASENDPTEIPAYAFHQYVTSSGFVPQGSNYVPHPTIQTQYISNTPGLHPGNSPYYVPLTWVALTSMYLDPQLAQTIQSGLGNIQSK